MPTSARDVLKEEPSEMNSASDLYDSESDESDDGDKYLNIEMLFRCLARRENIAILAVFDTPRELITLKSS